MKYGLYLTIDGGDETILVGLFRDKRRALEALEELSKNEDRIQKMAHGRNVTCLEVMNMHNYTTVKYIPAV